MYIGVCGAENFEVTGHVRTEGGHEGSLPPELTYTNANAHRHLIQHYPHHPKKQHTKAVAFSFSDMAEGGRPRRVMHARGGQGVDLTALRRRYQIINLSTL